MVWTRGFVLSDSAGYWRKLVHKIGSLWTALCLGLYLFTAYQIKLITRVAAWRKTALCCDDRMLVLKQKQQKLCLKLYSGLMPPENPLWDNLMRKMSLCKCVRQSKWIGWLILCSFTDQSAHSAHDVGMQHSQPHDGFIYTNREQGEKITPQNVIFALDGFPEAYNWCGTCSSSLLTENAYKH